MYYNYANKNQTIEFLKIYETRLSSLFFILYYCISWKLDRNVIKCIS